MGSLENGTVSPGTLWNTTCQRILNQGSKTYAFNLTSPFVTSSYAIGIINCSAALPTVALNLLLIVTICKTTTLQTKTNMIMLGLLIMNVLVGLFSLPTNGACIILTTMKISGCVARVFTALFGTSIVVASILVTMLLSYERYVAIVKPYSYEEQITNRKIICGILASFVTAFLTTLGIHINVTRLYAVFLMTAIILLGYTYHVVVYIKLFVVIRRIRLNLVTINVVNPVDNASINDDDAAAARIENQRKQRRTFKFTAYAIGFLLVFNLPSIFVYFSTQRFLGTFHMPFYAADTILCLHATCSPLHYIWQSPNLYRAIRNLFVSSNVPEITHQNDKQNCAPQT